MKSKWVARPPAVYGIKIFDNDDQATKHYREVIVAGNSNVLRPGHYHQKF